MPSSVKTSWNSVVNIRGIICTVLSALEELNTYGLDFQVLGSDVAPQKHISTNFLQRH